ncbi:MAG: hypothetical protein N2515_10805 [Deltaproteobacteria bacterium]|nr:hypothetical protein [Deltaproteobacteria bacterium]
MSERRSLAGSCAASQRRLLRAPISTRAYDAKNLRQSPSRPANRAARDTRHLHPRRLLRRLLQPPRLGQPGRPHRSLPRDRRRLLPCAHRHAPRARGPHARSLAGLAPTEEARPPLTTKANWQSINAKLRSKTSELLRADGFPRNNTALERGINERDNPLYGLTPEEIKIVGVGG